MFFEDRIVKFTTTITMLLVCSTGSYVSITALSLFLSAGIIGVFIGAGLEMGKFITIIYIHRSWKTNKSIRYLYLIIVILIMCLTTSELIGYLSYKHFKTAQSAKSSEKELIALNKEKNFLQKQVDLVEKNLSMLPLEYVKRRENARQSNEYKQKISRISEIMQRFREITVNQKSYLEGGPIYSTAELLGINPEFISKCFIILLVLVWEGLSTALIIVFSSVWKPDVVRKLKTTIQTEIPSDRFFEDNNSNRNSVLARIMNRANLDEKKIASITERKQIDTVKSWIEGKSEIPEKALKQVINFYKEMKEVGVGN